MYSQISGSPKIKLKTVGVSIRNFSPMMFFVAGSSSVSTPYFKYLSSFLDSLLLKNYNLFFFTNFKVQQRRTVGEWLVFLLNKHVYVRFKNENLLDCESFIVQYMFDKLKFLLYLQLYVFCRQASPQGHHNKTITSSNYVLNSVTNQLNLCMYLLLVDTVLANKQDMWCVFTLPTLLQGFEQLIIILKSKIKTHFLGFSFVKFPSKSLGFGFKTSNILKKKKACFAFFYPQSIGIKSTKTTLSTNNQALKNLYVRFCFINRTYMVVSLYMAINSGETLWYFLEGDETYRDWLFFLCSSLKGHVVCNCCYNETQLPCVAVSNSNSKVYHQARRPYLAYISSIKNTLTHHQTHPHQKTLNIFSRKNPKKPGELSTNLKTNFNSVKTPLKRCFFLKKFLCATETTLPLEVLKKSNCTLRMAIQFLYHEIKFNDAFCGLHHKQHETSLVYFFLTNLRTPLVHFFAKNDAMVFDSLVIRPYKSYNANKIDDYFGNNQMYSIKY